MRWLPWEAEPSARTAWEHDEHLARDHHLTSAAARMLADGDGVRTEADADGWFPFTCVTLTDLPSPCVEEEGR